MEYADAEIYCKAIAAKLRDPHRVVIFGPTEVKYKLFNQLQHEGFGGINSMEVVITAFMETGQQAEQFTLDYFKERPSF